MRYVLLSIRALLHVIYLVLMALLFLVTVPLWILGGILGALCLPFCVAFVAMYELAASRSARTLKRIDPASWSRATGDKGDAFEPSSLGRN